jgi:hypothetical protein
MLNEYKDWIRDKNYDLCQEYPFLIPRNLFTDEIISDYDYSFTYLDECPIGWQPLFLEMCEIIKPILEDAGLLNYFRLVQIKEKYGRLTIYHAGAPSNVDNVINYYENLSRRVCIKCGNPATKISIGWISPWCERCAAECGQECDDINEWLDKLEVKKK